MSKRIFHLRRLIATFALILLAACGGEAWYGTNITGLMPRLDFSMTRVSDGKRVTAAEYRGDVVLLYFGYTFCPDRCPMALMYVDDMLKKLGPQGKRVRMLFVTVDPNRDTPKHLAQYVENFSEQVDGLRGTPDELARLARRYRAVYSVKPATKDHPYEVTHGSAIYVFDETGAARLLIDSAALESDGIQGLTEDVQTLLRRTRTAPAAGTH